MPGEAVEAGIEGQDLLDAVLFHDGQMHSITGVHLAAPQDNLFRTLGDSAINRQHLIDDAE